MARNPTQLFASWLKAARKHPKIVDATAACLSTMGTDDYPEGRMVLLKDFDDRGFVFYTNLRSPKGRAIERLPRAALTFHWAPLEHQVRVQGKTEIVSEKEADAYWTTRPRQTQLGAWASRQSHNLPTRATLLKAVAHYVKKFAGKPVPRPPHWTGVRIVPRRIEFWLGRASRLHDRLLYTRQSNRWISSRLFP